MPFVEDVRALVDERIDRSLHDLLVGDGAYPVAEFVAVGFDDGVRFRVGQGGVAVRLVAIEALARFLAVAPRLIKAVQQRRGVGPALLQAPLADVPVHVDAGQIADGERPHGHAPACQRRVDVGRRRALLDDERWPR